MHNQIEYLGHIILVEGIKTYPSKLEAIVVWPKPQTIKALRGLLGLTRYYRIFVRNYGVISKPLTNMFKMNSFLWSKEAEATFEALETTLCTTLVLSLSDFQKEYVIEANANHKGMRAVLMQNGKPMAFHSKEFGNKHLGLSIYVNEYLSIINVV